MLVGAERVERETEGVERGKRSEEEDPMQIEDEEESNIFSLPFSFSSLRRSISLPSCSEDSCPDLCTQGGLELRFDSRREEEREREKKKHAARRKKRGKLSLSSFFSVPSF